MSYLGSKFKGGLLCLSMPRLVVALLGTGLGG